MTEKGIKTMSKTKIKNMSEEVNKEKSEKGQEISPAETLTAKDAKGGAEERSQASTAANIVSEDAPDEKVQATFEPERQDPEQKAEEPKKEKKAKKLKVGKRKRSKKYQEKIQILIEKSKEGLEEGEELPNFKAKTYPLAEAVELAKQLSYSKFDGSLELHINTNSKSVRGLVSLPFASGKTLKVIAFGKGAEESGADFIGDDEALKEIEKGKINFDVLVTTPEWMPKLARAAKVLGPKGLMPNPKNGTITSPSADGLKKAVTEIQSGKVEYKNEKGASVIHLGIGKVSQPSEELNQNIKLLLTTIGKSKVKKVTIAASMGPGVKIDLSSI